MIDPAEMIAALVATSSFAKAAMKHKVMENGEQRFSVKFPGGDWTLTIAGRDGGWQNAHYHGGPQALEGRGINEHYVVHERWVAVAMLDPRDSRPRITIIEANGQISFQPGEAHNIYLPPDAVISTVKSGESVGNPEKKGNDWWPQDRLDEWSKQFTTAEAILAEAARVADHQS